MTSTPQLTPDALESAIIVATKEQISSDLAGEAVILDVRSGIYYGLNEVGARIWALIQQPRSVREIRHTLLTEYALDSEECDRDLLHLFQNLAAVKLIEVRHEKAT